MSIPDSLPGGNLPADPVLCPVNPIGHEWDGLGCSWCPATRTPAEAIVSGLASRRGGDRGNARTLLDAYRAEALREAADLFEQAGRIVLDGGIMTAAEAADHLRDLAAKPGEEATPAGATATPEPDFFVAGRVYTRTDRTGLHLRFFCEHLTTDPKVGDREAWGWLRRSNGTRRMLRAWDHDFPLWTPEAGEGRG